jgi:hypothetical protein
LATDDPVMAIGGFNGSDPTPTLAAFTSDVVAHKIHCFIAGSAGGVGRWRGRYRVLRRFLADHVVGGVALHLHDYRRGDGLRLHLLKKNITGWLTSGVRSA